MALGCPIVAIDQGVKFDCDEFIKKARNKKDFVDAIVDVLEEKKQSGESLEDFRTLTLNPNERVAGSCSFQKSFYIGSKIKRGSRVMTLTSFSLNNISVEIEK